MVLNKDSEIFIMEDVSYVKSKDAGNYRFNPLCDTVEIFIKMKNRQIFDYHFTVAGNIEQINISFNGIDPIKWNKNKMNLTPKSSIQ